MGAFGLAPKHSASFSSPSPPVTSVVARSRSLSYPSGLSHESPLTQVREGFVSWSPHSPPPACLWKCARTNHHNCYCSTKTSTTIAAAATVLLQLLLSLLAC